MTGPTPTDTPMAQIDLRTHSLTGWPQRAECPHCGGELVLLVAQHARASYECRGSLPHPAGSAYTDDRCRGQWSVQRYERVEAEPECVAGPEGCDPRGGEMVCCAVCGAPVCDYHGRNEHDEPDGDWLCPQH